MAMCEKCWSDAYRMSYGDTSKTQGDYYRQLIEERKDNPCSEDEQNGNYRQPPKAETA